MSERIDCYFLLKSREFSVIEGFLNKIVPNKVECSEYYEVPQYSEQPLKTFKQVKGLMYFLEELNNEEYSIYWSNLDYDNVIKNIMLFYTNDKMVILGISIAGKFPFDRNVIATFQDLFKLLLAETGCITVEEPPPSNSIEFYKFCSERFNTSKMII